MKNLKMTSFLPSRLVVVFVFVLAACVMAGLTNSAMAVVTPCAGPVSENSNGGAGDPASGSTAGTSDKTLPINDNPDCDDKSPSGLQTCLKNNKIIKDLNAIVDFLSAGVGIVVVASIILGGIQYAMAGGSPEAVTKAKSRITNALLALVIFIFIFAFLQWIIPGGI
jgi:hypothetical protein